MASKRTSDDERELEEEVVVAKEQPASYNKSRTVKLVSMISARIRLDGPNSGKRYTWERAGAVVAVNEEDAELLLQKKLGEKPCCGGSPNYLFSIVE